MFIQGFYRSNEGSCKLLHSNLLPSAEYLDTTGCVFRNQAAVVIRIRENWREQGRFGMGGINTPYGMDEQ